MPISQVGQSCTFLLIGDPLTASASIRVIICASHMLTWGPASIDQSCSWLIAPSLAFFWRSQQARWGRTAPWLSNLQKKAFSHFLLSCTNRLDSDKKPIHFNQFYTTRSHHNSSPTCDTLVVKNIIKGSSWAISNFQLASLFRPLLLNIHENPMYSEHYKAFQLLVALPLNNYDKMNSSLDDVAKAILLFVLEQLNTRV